MLLILINLILLFLSAFFSASETALFSIPREQVQGLKKSSRISGKYIYDLLVDGQRTLMVILIGNLAVNITIVGTIDALLNRYLIFSNVWITFIFATGVIIVFGEIIPKNLAVRNNYFISSFSAPVLFYFKIAVKPIAIIMEKVNVSMLTQVSRYLRQPSPYITMDEIKNELKDSKSEGVITGDEFNLLQKVIKSTDLSVSSAVIHRSELLFLEENFTCEEAVSFMGKNDAWFSLFGNKERGEVERVLFMEDLLLTEGKDLAVDFAQEIQAVVSTMKIADVTFMLSKNQWRIVVVNDEYGDLQGVFSINSGLKRMLELSKEKDSGTKEIFLKGLDQISDILNWIPQSLQEEALKYKTLNGLITGYLGRIPESGERFAIDDRIFYIISSNKRIIETIRIVKGNKNVS